jgi:hypothetical protein
MEGEPLVRLKPQAGVAAGECGDCDLSSFQLPEVRAQAVVQALAESEVASGVRPVHVKPIRLADGRSIPARGRQPQEELGPLGGPRLH